MLQNLMRRAISLFNFAPMQYPENSIGCWLDQIKDPEIRAKAFANAEASYARKGLMLVDNPVRFQNMPNAIGSAFVWAATPEGAAFWLNFVKSHINSWTN